MVFSNTSVSQTKLEEELAKQREKFQKELAGLQQALVEARKAQEEASAQHDRNYAELLATIERVYADADTREEKHRQALQQETDARLAQVTEHRSQMQSLQQRLQAAQLNRDPSPDPPPYYTAPDACGASTSEESASTGATVLSLSMVGKNYFYCGKKHNYWQLSKTMMTTMKKGEDCHNFAAIGTDKSWIRSYTNDDGINYIDRSGNFDEEYPDLYAFIERHNLSRKPYCLSLGTDGSYFFYSKNKRDWKLAAAVEENLKDPLKCNRMWFGRHGAYVAVCEKDSMKWDLKSGYSGLATVLLATKGVPEHVCMNLEDDDWLIVWPNGTCNWRTSCSGVDPEYVKKFLTVNKLGGMGTDL